MLPRMCLPPEPRAFKSTSPSTATGRLRDFLFRLVLGTPFRQSPTGQKHSLGQIETINLTPDERPAIAVP